MVTWFFRTIVSAIILSVWNASFGAEKVSLEGHADAGARVGLFIDSLMHAYEIPGALVGIWKNDSTVALIAKGKSDIKSGRPMERGDQVRIGSITKTFVASVALELVDEGKLSLGDTLKKYLPQVPGASRIVIRQLCNHTSGVHDVIEDTANGCSFLNHPARRVTEQNFIDCLKETKGDFEPGTRFSYSNTGFILLGMVIEKISGHSVDQEIRERLLNPLHLRGTAFPRDAAFPRRFCHGYRFDAAARRLRDVSAIDPTGVGCAGAMVSTLDDLKKWDAALVKGAFLRPATSKERLTFSQGWNETSRYGLGIMKIKTYLGHSGGILGYNTGMFADPDAHIFIVVIFNNCNYVDGHMTEAILGISRILDETTKK
jgi:D-alanyl-D-alanine carboxypeptidase